jgi:hypothetical protein
MIGRDMQHARGGNGFNDMVGTQEQISKIRHGRRELQKLYTILAAKGSVLSTEELLTLFGTTSCHIYGPSCGETNRFDSEGVNFLAQRVSNVFADRWRTST